MGGRCSKTVPEDIAFQGIKDVQTQQVRPSCDNIMRRSPSIFRNNQAFIDYVKEKNNIYTINEAKVSMTYLQYNTKSKKQ